MNGQERLELEYKIERAIDKAGLPAVLDLIANICLEKANHIATNYGEGLAVDTWNKSADLITETADQIRQNG